MANLILLQGNETTNLNEVAVHPEEAIERTIFENPQILSDILLLKRQLATYTKEDRIDIVGLDSENNIVVVELKDERVDEDVIPQVLRYALWLESYPDAIKSIWLENKHLAPDDFTFDWDKDFDLRIVIVGPSFKPALQRLVHRITYPVELIEFKQFIDGDRRYVFLNKVATEEDKRFKPVSTTREYDLDFYAKNRNPASAKQFWRLAERVEQYAAHQGWNLTRSNNMSYISFKYGFPIVFGVTFLGTKSFGLFFKIPKEVADVAGADGPSMLRYEQQWNQAIYKVDSGEVDLSTFDQLFGAAYNKALGKSAAQPAAQSVPSGSLVISVGQDLEASAPADTQRGRAE
ncbi:MAG: DUF91 domain-containing protein [Chloroflexi bacterium]|nr:DUF91 domain-containing protein [Chloroflexota bacterium]